MRERLLLFFVFFLAVCIHAAAQDIPLFTQKLTNSFIYNPATAGLTFGSATYSFRQNYANVKGAPTNNFLSLHTPLINHKVGIGANIYQEDVNFIRNIYASGAFAYHLYFDQTNILSMGVAGEYNSSRLNGQTNSDPTDIDYIRLANGDIQAFDFSFGLNFKSRFFQIGIAANRLGSEWLQDSASFTSFYTGYAQGMIPLRGGLDLLEPYAAYRKLSPINNSIDLGLFYTFNNRIIGGIGLRNTQATRFDENSINKSGQIINTSLGFKITKNLMIGYSREMVMGNVGGYVGAANEFVLRVDFNNKEVQQKKNFRADYKNSLTYRRKSLSTAYGKSVGSKSPQQLKKKQKKYAPYSPNKRYQNVNKMGMKKKPSSKSKTTFNGKKPYNTPKKKSSIKKKKSSFNKKKAYNKRKKK